jgi:hypothetical protein
VTNCSARNAPPFPPHHRPSPVCTSAEVFSHSRARRCSAVAVRRQNRTFLQPPTRNKLGQSKSTSSHKTSPVQASRQEVRRLNSPPSTSALLPPQRRTLSIRRVPSRGGSEQRSCCRVGWGGAVIRLGRDCAVVECEVRAWRDQPGHPMTRALHALVARALPRALWRNPELDLK